MSDVIIGIDNGLKGGLCAISSEHGLVIRHTPMPVKDIGNKTEVDVSGLVSWIKDFTGDDVVVAIEEPLKHARSSQAMRSMAISFGKCLGACETIPVSVYRIQVTDWQKKILGRVAKGQTKARALAVADSIWSGESWLASARSRTPHDGIVDAALIAHYTRTTLKP